MLSRLRLLTAGESHGPRLTAVLDGVPAGFAVRSERIDALLARRQRAFGAGGRMKIERDRARFTAGVLAGRTTGAPIAIEIDNLDWPNWRDRDIDPMTTPRPGHADLVGAIKYGHRELRLSLERASARETAARVAACGVLGCVLDELGVEVGGYVRHLAGVDVELDDACDADGYRERWREAASSDLALPHPTDAERIRREIQEVMKAHDTLGGIFEVVALGVPPGLGSYDQWDRRLEARLALALMSIPAIKGVEIGPAFENARRRGTAAHDDIVRDDAGSLHRTSNRAGGFEGGVTNGEPIVARVAMKPLSTTLTPRRTVDLATGRPTETVYERSDFSALPRAVVVGEAMTILVLADALLEKLGGDGRDEILARLATLRRARLEDLPMDASPWRFGIDG